MFEHSQRAIVGAAADSTTIRTLPTWQPRCRGLGAELDVRTPSVRAGDWRGSVVEAAPGTADCRGKCEG